MPAISRFPACMNTRTFTSLSQALPESAAAKVQGMLQLQLRLASQLNELAERVKAGERGGAGGLGAAATAVPGRRVVSH